MKNSHGKEACPKCGREAKWHESFISAFWRALGKREAVYKCGGCGYLFEEKVK